MSDNRATEPAAPPRRPVQFTVRTFFAAAVLVSLFAATAKLPAEKPRICVLAFLAWLTAAGFYRTIGARRPLVTLALAPLVLVAGWILSIPLPPMSSQIRSEMELWMILPGAFVWGIELSIVVMLATGLAWLGGRLGMGIGRRARQPPSSARRARGWSPAWKLAALMLLLRLALSGIQTVVTALVSRSSSTWEAALGAAFLIDGPLAPFYYALYPSPPQTARGMILVTTALGVPLYAAMGWLIGRLARGGRATATLHAPGAADALAAGKGAPSEAVADTR
jgi:hypothetical protein